WPAQGPQYPRRSRAARDSARASLSLLPPLPRTSYFVLRTCPQSPIHCLPHIGFADRAEAPAPGIVVPASALIVTVAGDVARKNAIGGIPRAVALRAGWSEQPDDGRAKRRGHVRRARVARDHDRGLSGD